MKMGWSRRETMIQTDIPFQLIYMMVWARGRRSFFEHFFPGSRSKAFSSGVESVSETLFVNSKSTLLHASFRPNGATPLINDQTPPPHSMNILLQALLFLFGSSKKAQRAEQGRGTFVQGLFRPCSWGVMMSLCRNCHWPPKYPTHR